MSITGQETRLVSAPVAGAAYPGKSIDSTLYHCVEVEGAKVLRVLCNKVRAENILDDSTQFNVHDITCRTCLRNAERAARAAAPKAYGGGRG